MKVLSLFDWIACWYEALLRAGFNVEKYYASEIDKYAIQIATKNHPDIIEIGDVCNVQWKDYQNIDLLIGGSPCFVKWTKVWTTDWYKDISEIVVWDNVLWLWWEYNEVVKTWWQKKQIWSIKWQWFLETLTTENHPYYVAKCKRVWHDSHRELWEPEWRQVKDIEIWDYVWLPIIHQENNIKWITKQEAWLLWRYMADWHTRKDFRKWTNNRYWSVIYSVWDSKLDDFKHITEYHIWKQKHTQSTHRFVISSKRLVELCEDIWCWAYNKSIPNYILNLPIDLMTEFFKWYMSWDWFYKWNWVWRCNTISREMAMSLCLLSATLFHTWWQIHFIKKEKTYTIQWRTVNQHDYYEVEIKEYRKAQDHYIVTDDYIRFPIKEIKQLWYEDTVYNIEVANSNSYTANNIVVHNCQWFSMAWKMLNFNDPRSKLFFEYVRLLNEIKPKYFLLENVKMKKEFRDTINSYLRWIEPTLIDSALVSAQHRERYYRVWVLQDDWTYAKVDIPQPEDKGILLKDILLDEVDRKYDFSQERWDRILNGNYDIVKRLEDPLDKCNTITTVWWGNHEKKVFVSYTPWSREFVANWWKEFKCPTLTARDYKDPRVLYKNWKIRKLTPIEYERLQTLPDNYTAWVSDTQRYKALGNWWTVDVISHILKNLK